MIRLTNSLTRSKDPFEPADPARVTMYVCGPTVYNYAHIGNARGAVVFDQLFRLLRHHYGADHIVYARNVTDIDDKIIKRAAATGESVEAITTRFAGIYRADMAALGCLPPSIEPQATAHLPEMIAMIEGLISRGHAYVAEGHVLFAIRSYEDYGQLSRRNRDEMIAGARVEVAPYKQDPADFVLWKPSEPDQPGWESPWGRGRPGWHVECSAMIETHLGITIDIHGGGTDLAFPHHENEIAQGTCAHDGALYSRFWLHNGFLNVNAEKMAKSLGNVILVHDLLDAGIAGETIRHALLSAHYRAPFEWRDDTLAQAKSALDRLYQPLRGVAPAPAPVPDAVVAALADDLNTPQAFAELFQLARAANTAEGAAKAEAAGALKAAGNLLGVLANDPEDWFAAAANDADAARIDALIAERRTARQEKNFARADAIRDQLASEGITLEDKPEGTIWRRG